MHFNAGAEQSSYIPAAGRRSCQDQVSNGALSDRNILRRFGRLYYDLLQFASCRTCADKTGVERSVVSTSPGVSRAPLLEARSTPLHRADSSLAGRLPSTGGTASRYRRILEVADHRIRIGEQAIDRGGIRSVSRA
jgi:hypothetical protein